MTYGHEAQVLKSIASALWQSPIVWDMKRESWLAHADSSQVFLGSGQSNAGTRLVLGRPDKEILFSPQIGTHIVELEYSIGTGEGSLNRWQYHELINRQRLAICHRQGRKIVLAEGTSAKLQSDDYLLITRIPGPAPKTVVTVFSGLHGPGTRATELLFKAVSLKDLEDLASRIGYVPGQVPYYQAVFRASEFRKDEIEGSAIPTRIELVTDGCPPKRIS